MAQQSTKRDTRCKEPLEIMSDASLAEDEIGVPQSVASKLTTRVPVTTDNLKTMQDYVRATEYPQAVAIYVKDGIRIPLAEVDRSKFTIHVDWIVERHLSDGDFVTFNSAAAPLQSRRVKVIKSESIKLPMAPTSLDTFNADFDGYSFNCR